MCTYSISALEFYLIIFLPFWLDTNHLKETHCLICFSSGCITMTSFSLSFPFLFGLFSFKKNFVLLNTMYTGIFVIFCGYEYEIASAATDAKIELKLYVEYLSSGFNSLFFTLGWMDS